MKPLILGLTATSLTALFGARRLPNRTQDGGRSGGAQRRGTGGANPNVTKYAPTELDRARKLLINAEGSAEQKGATDKVTSALRLSGHQMARIAEQRAHEQVAVARIKAGETDGSRSCCRRARTKPSRPKALPSRRATKRRTRRRNSPRPQAESQRLPQQMENLQAAQT